MNSLSRTATIKILSDIADNAELQLKAEEAYITELEEAHVRDRHQEIVLNAPFVANDLGTVLHYLSHADTVAS